MSSDEGFPPRMAPSGGGGGGRGSRFPPIAGPVPGFSARPGSGSAFERAPAPYLPEHVGGVPARGALGPQTSFAHAYGPGSTSAPLFPHRFAQDHQGPWPAGFEPAHGAGVGVPPSPAVGRFRGSSTASLGNYSDAGSTSSSGLYRTAEPDRFAEYSSQEWESSLARSSAEGYLHEQGLAETSPTSAGLHMDLDVRSGGTSGGKASGGKAFGQRRPSNRDEFDGPHQLLEKPLAAVLASQDRELPHLPTHLEVREQDDILGQVNDRLSLCAFNFVARYQFPVPLEPDKRPVRAPQDREWTEWVYLLKRLATKRRIPARVLYNNQIKQLVTVLENSMEMRHAAKHQSRPLKDDRNVLQLISAGIQVAKILKDADAMEYLDQLYVHTEDLIAMRKTGLMMPPPAPGALVPPPAPAPGPLGPVGSFR